MSLPVRLRSAHHAVRRQLLRRRRGLAALCVAGAVAATLHATAAPPPATTRVLVAGRDLPAGTSLTAADLTAVELPPEAVPGGVVDDPAGRTLAGPLRPGEPVTDVRLVGDSLADAHPGLATLPVRLPDAEAAALLEPGDEIDLVATDPQGRGTEVVASGVLVLAAPTSAASTGATGTAAGGSASPGVVVVLGLPSGAVPAVADAAVTRYLGFAWAR